MYSGEGRWGEGDRSAVGRRGRGERGSRGGVGMGGGRVLGGVGREFGEEGDRDDRWSAEKRWAMSHKSEVEEKVGVGLVWWLSDMSKL